ncbi:hypothetical protein [Pelomonas sp. Root1444]|uniref:hypothetical protein n=1 Tax=Pelomonas sp. Root1444 TaxID=1736464 RepID=UPI0012F808D5|nr:hypothetical protein [Pelomonas sp. Root1444]
MDVPLTDGLDGWVASALMYWYSEHLANTQQIAIFVDNGELPHAPRLVFDGIHARTASLGQTCCQECFVQGLDIGDPQVAARPRLGWHQLGMKKEVKLKIAPSEDGIGITNDFALKSKASIERQGAWQ